jgi:molybdopterin-containing oxidoreductase family iron-sulfur binding subunit
MTLDDIRTKLNGLEGRAYWRSLEELSGTPDFQSYLHEEFPANAAEFTDPAGRRQFLKLMGASLALAGVSACTRQPPEKLVPYVTQPEEIVPGRPLFYATSMPIGGVGMPLLAENHMGRPTKLEGNPEHPASLGATDVLAQASVLNLYDPDRSRNILNLGNEATWPTLTAALQTALAPLRSAGGAGFRILTEPISSPTVIDQMETLMTALPQVKWHQWDPVYGTVQGGAPDAQAIYHLDKADVVVSLDADFLGFGPTAIRNTKDFSSRRRMGTPTDALNRLYVVEPSLTLTGANAEHRLTIKARDVYGFATALASALGVAGVPAAPAVSDDAGRWIPVLVDDLRAHHGRAVVVAGDHQPAAVHALARAINDAIGGTGTTVVYAAPVVATPRDGIASLRELVTDMNAGAVQLLLIVGTNPVFTAPADLDFLTALKKVPLRIHLGQQDDETGDECQWHVPEAHYLESWGDVRAFDGTVSLIQPLIEPLYGGHSFLEVLASINGVGGQSTQDLVKGYWTKAFNGQTKTKWTLQDREGRPFPTVDAFWRQALYDGFLASTSLLTGAVPTPAAPATPLSLTPPPAMTGLEIIFQPDPYILDGRNANNGWLQETPKPLSKVTWDAIAYVSPRTAERFGVMSFQRSGNGDLPLVEIQYRGRKAKMAIWPLPGTADDVVVVHFGYGRTRAGRVGTKVGQNLFTLRTSAAPWFDGGVELHETGEKYLIVSTQNHFAMEGRAPVRVVEAEEFAKNAKAVAELGAERPGPEVSLYKPFEYNGHKWGMAIDLNACTGCNACITACVAENNISVVGKDQVERTREMHWIRIDTYYEGDPSKPDGVYHQPVPCQQCEDAPCEVVCPVGATVHSDEGLNDMVYNRCVGTRYCSNNCPYKVRRFNFLLYSDFTTPELMAQRNPDVTIRSRGVMEKCTYCVQRINHARIDSKVQNRPIKDGEIKTACQQVCPADAIVFGDLNDPASRVVALKAQERNYGLLEETGTRPRTSYLAKVRNRNPALS